MNSSCKEAKANKNEKEEVNERDSRILYIDIDIT
jgi:hypothetical protein